LADDGGRQCPRIAAFLILALSLAGCDAVNTLTDGFKHARAVEDELQASIGIRPQVGFNWSNGRLVNVTVAFPTLYVDKPLTQLADTVRRAVTSEFKQAPGDIVLAFSLGSTPSDAAQLQVPLVPAPNRNPRSGA
jgi:hypothetical protein